MGENGYHQIQGDRVSAFPNHELLSINGLRLCLDMHRRSVLRSDLNLELSLRVLGCLPQGHLGQEILSQVCCHV